MSKSQKNKQNSKYKVGDHVTLKKPYHRFKKYIIYTVTDSCKDKNHAIELDGNTDRVPTKYIKKYKDRTNKNKK